MEKHHHRGGYLDLITGMRAGGVSRAKLVGALLFCAAQPSAGDVMVDNLLSYVERSRDIFMAGPGDIACKAASMPPFASAHELQRVILARVYFVYVHDKGSFNIPDSESAPALFARPPFAHRAWHCGFDATVSHRRSLLLTTRLPAQGGFCEDIPYIFYVGNEGGDLDSIVSSVGAAYIRNRGRGAAIHIPIMCAANRA